MSSSAKPAAPAMVERTCFDKSKALRPKVHSVIPGGAHTYAKGDDQYPELSPGFIERGKGCHIWDVDGNEFIEYGMGLRAVTLGHAYPSVIEAAYRQMQLGNNFNRPAPIELECAQMLQSLVPSAEMVKFAKDGSTILTAALKLARAHTGRKLVAICSNSPFFSYNDWFIGTTAMDGGVNRAEVFCGEKISAETAEAFVPQCADALEVAAQAGREGGGVGAQQGEVADAAHHGEAAVHFRCGGARPGAGFGVLRPDVQMALGQILGDGEAVPHHRAAVVQRGHLRSGRKRPPLRPLRVFVVDKMVQRFLKGDAAGFHQQPRPQRP